MSFGNVLSSVLHYMSVQAPSREHLPFVLLKIPWNAVDLYFVVCDCTHSVSDPCKPCARSSPHWNYFYLARNLY